MNLARKHFQQHQAKSAAESAAEFGTMQNTNAYEQQLMQLNSDKNRLKNIQSKQNKVELKRQLLPNYKPYLQGILEVKPGVQDAVVTEMLVWSIDVGEYDFALDLAEYVLKFGLKLPDRFERSEACFITEDIADEFLKVLKTDVHVDITVLERLESLITDESLDKSKRDMPDEVKAKLYLALGKAEMRLITGENEQDVHHAINAKNYLESAVNLDDKCGGRTDLNKMTKLVQKINPMTTQNLAKASSTTDLHEQPTENNPIQILNPEGTTEQPEATNVLLNQNGTPVVDDHGSMVPASE
ncbi:phage terminase small subunit [Acinetobacter ursingii]|uniref:phage terminase small subunit n=1 Tax=Acinetobacter ursingii TaxID=108980 RepID=UPI000CC92847|nr:phage terminase small subunit [Acinetobacter ursingii]MDG9860948.1 phage terminase small subunit [Acinetobacter ursingii]MDG9892270.1 phage terminase small subunit [Acinetobacter ursingii]MDH0005983.1 phage terminase small subunit [Acinetobacter ursingii]MDH0477521.1 phage terminase small subunit [Acinetobacter ursingii]MDH2118360.1 phage terminase small subunit [Acinetobacter ursingii]